MSILGLYFVAYSWAQSRNITKGLKQNTKIGLSKDVICHADRGYLRDRLGVYVCMLLMAISELTSGAW